jgi:hypothetical protein
MIVFDLRCSEDHRFEGWFDNIDDLESQLAQGQIACPCCGDINIGRLLSPVSIKKKTSPNDDSKRAYKTWQTLCRYVQKNFEDVGHNFAQEALKVHYGHGEERKIRGVTTESEEDMLKKEGVPFVKIPMPPEMDS